MKTLKAWKMEEAERRGVAYRTICNGLSRGSIPYPDVVRLNARVVLVVEPVHEPRERRDNRPVFRVPVTRREFLSLPMPIRDRALREMAEKQARAESRRKP